MRREFKHHSAALINNQAVMPRISRFILAPSPLDNPSDYLAVSPSLLEL